MLLVGRKNPVERFGLFTIIVLGEVIVGVVRGVAEHHHLSWLVGGTAALGMLIAIGIWWIYFDFLSRQAPRAGRFAVMAWFYLHLIMTASIAAIGAAVVNVAEQAGGSRSSYVRGLLVGSIAVALLSISMLMRTVGGSEALQRIRRIGSWVTLVSAILVIPFSFSGLSIIPLLVILVLLVLAPVAAGFWAWIRTREVAHDATDEEGMD
jgi:low temperature requirement protein LtrA